MGERHLVLSSMLYGDATKLGVRSWSHRPSYMPVALNGDGGTITWRQQGMGKRECELKFGESICCVETNLVVFQAAPEKSTKATAGKESRYKCRCSPRRTKGEPPGLHVSGRSQSYPRANLQKCERILYSHGWAIVQPTRRSCYGSC